MARIWFITHFLPVCFAASFPASAAGLIKAAGVGHSQRVAGVFMFIEGEKYTFNFTSATAACLSLNVTIATEDQMMRALQQGLETCKYGWIAEQIAAIPRITPNTKCGQGQTGLVRWFAGADRKFAVFCFNASDIEETSNTPKAAPQTTFSSPTTATALTLTATPTTTELTSTTEEPKTTTTKPPEDTSSTSPVETTRSTGIFSTSTSLETSSARFPTSPSHPTTVIITLVSSTSVPVLPHNVSSARSSLAAVPTALIILGVILLLLAAAGVVSYYKLNIFTLWPLGQQKDDTETEMWKHTDSEMDLHGQHGAEEDDAYDESDRKYSSDITLCVNPDLKAIYTE